MMSLLILNQKVLYLVLLITLLYGLTSAIQNITIYVQEEGIDQSECMEGNGSIPCHTLSYVLSQINNRSDDTFNGTNISVYVYITYYQEITNLSLIQLLVNLYLIGVDNPVLDFSGIDDVFAVYGGGSFSAENITYYNIWVSFYFIVTVSFNKCIFTSGNSTLADIETLSTKYIYNLALSNCLFRINNAQSAFILIQSVSNVEISGCEFYDEDGFIRIELEQVHNLTIINCLFHNNDGELALIWIQNVFNVDISGCEFYQNKYQTSLISEQVHNLTINNCSFHNNDAQSKLIVIQNVFNVDISGCEFYRNEGQMYLIMIMIGSEQVHNLTISNCLFHNNDAQSELFHNNEALSGLIGIGNVLNVEISECEFFQNEGQISIGFEQVHNLTVSNCLFGNNVAQIALVGIQNVSNVGISGCEFQNSQSYLILIESPNFITISNCLFHNNDAQQLLIMIENVSNVEISGCEFYQNEGQKYLIMISIGLEQIHNLINISNCLFYNNDAQLYTLVGIQNISNVEISDEFYKNSQPYLKWSSLEQVRNLTISNCLFHNNDAQQALILIFYGIFFNVEISGCEFYQNEGQTHLIMFESEQVHNLIISNCLFYNNEAQQQLISIHQVHNFTISNCLFCNNDAQQMLIMIYYVFNVEISGCEFYQNRGQESLLLVLTYFFDMDNCTIYDNNDIKDTIFNLGTSSSESMFTITNCLFSNNTSGANILGITSDKLYMSNINLVSNKIKWIEYSIIRITGILLSHEQNLNISNINFINNTGTGLKLKDVKMYFNNITFYNNTGVHGGGMSLYHTHIYLIGPLIFERNTALFGGAIYFAIAEVLGVPDNCTTFERIIFTGNSAGTLGPDVFIEDGFSVSDIIYYTFPCINNTIQNHVRGDHIISGPYNITINPQSNSTITLFPGQKLTYSAKVTDYFGNLTSCLVNIILECGNNFCEHVQLTGEAQSLLSTSNFTTSLYLTSNVEHHDYSLKLRFLCLDTNAEVYANMNLTTCPLGYVFQTLQKSQRILGTCECVDIASDNVQCDFMLGVACIRLGYWLGKINADDVLEDTLIDTALCQYPYCKTDLPPCPIIGLIQTYNQLPVAQDEQCNGLYGGLLCRSCREDAVFSFEAVNCIPSSKCELWQPYVTLLLVVVFQLVLGFVIVMVLKASFKTGIGHLYGPLFFIAVLRLIPFGYYKQYVQLEFIISIFQSVLLLNLEVFGQLPWCFFSDINPLLNYSLHFLGPFIIAVVLLSTVLLARYYPRQFLSIQSSPVQAICLLILLSFWSVSDTCIQLLKPTTTLSGVKGWRVALQPNIQYLKDPYHIVTWIISTVLLIFLLVPFILLLFLSPLLRRKFNLTRIQPLLDAFQSCYDDKFRWYSGVYLLSWIILNINMPYYVMEIILVSISILHFMIQPYKYRWLNIVDTLLLVDLIMFAFFTSVDSPNRKETVPISYILVVLPLTYITIGVVWIISVIIRKWCKCKVSTRKNTNEEEMVNLLEDEEEEEVVDSGDRDIHIGVSSTVVERPVCRRDSLIFDDN